jgi:branched-chain amino acid transport system substrate-binding protein
VPYKEENKTMKKMFRLSLFALIVLLLAACAAPAATTAPEAEMTEESAPPAATEEAMTEEAMTEEAAPAMEEVTLTIGFTASQTGSLEVESSRQVNGLNLWVQQTNDAGGLTIGNQVVKFDTVSYDDESTKDRVQELYTRLATEDNADFLISPYSSGLADASAVIAEQYGKVMLTTGAAQDSTYQKGYTKVFQLYTPGSHYFTAAIDQLASLDASAKKIAIVYENSNFSISVVEGLKAYAESKGYDVVLYEAYDVGTTDFGPFINKIEAAEPDAILGGGHFEDGAALARQLYEKNVSIKYFGLLVAPATPDFADLGDAALGIVYPSQWDKNAAYTEEAAATMGIPFYGPSSADFNSAFNAAYGEDPSYHAAGGYEAGLILQKAMEDAGSTDPDAVAAALDNLDIMTFFGHIKFDTSPENHGLQIGHDMVYVQWQTNDAGDLARVLVWPQGGAAADALYPIR